MKQNTSHKFVKPYDRQQSKQDLVIMVNDYFNNHQQEHALLFCSGLEICSYAAQDCMYSKKKCYYE